MKPFPPIALVLLLFASPLQAQDPKKVNNFNPTEETTIVVNMTEFPSGISNFVNYAVGFGTPHQDKLRKIRSVSDIKHIVLHETSGPIEGPGFNTNGASAHFSVIKRGILQFNDLVEEEFHAGSFNATSIGIEFANPDWVRTKNSKHTYLDLNWDGNHPIYTLPQTNQLESLISLLQRILNKSEAGFPTIKTNWLQVVSYNDITNFWDFKTNDIPATDQGKKEKRFFIYTSAYGYMTPANMTESGLLSHDSISSLMTITVDGSSQTVVNEDAHTDGSFQALYSYLRIARSMDQPTAFSTAKKLLPKAEMIRVTTKTAYKGYHKKAGAWVKYADATKRPVFLADLKKI